MEVEGRGPLTCPGSEDTPAELLGTTMKQTVELIFARIAEDFPCLPIYTFSNGRLQLWRRSDVSFDEGYSPIHRRGRPRSRRSRYVAVSRGLLWAGTLSMFTPEGAGRWRSASRGPPRP